MRTLMTALFASVLLWPLSPASAAGLDGSTRTTVADWARERDEAAAQFLRSWLRGESPRDRVPAGLTVLAREAGIIGLIRDKDPDLLRRASLLWGRRVAPETLPAILLERRGIRFDPVGLFEGRTVDAGTADRPRIGR
jgi:hypothetical protein